MESDKSYSDVITLPEQPSDMIEQTELSLQGLSEHLAVAKYIQSVGGAVTNGVGKGPESAITSELKNHGFARRDVAKGLSWLVSKEILGTTKDDKNRITGYELNVQDVEDKIKEAESENEDNADANIAKQAKKIGDNYDTKSYGLIDRNAMARHIETIMESNKGKFAENKTEFVLSVVSRHYALKVSEAVASTTSEMSKIAKTQDNLDPDKHEVGLSAIKNVVNNDSILNKAESDLLADRFGLREVDPKFIHQLAAKYNLTNDEAAKRIWTSLSKINRAAKELTDNEIPSQNKGRKQKQFEDEALARYANRAANVQINGISPTSSFINKTVQAVHLVYSLPEKEIHGLKSSENITIEKNNVHIRLYPNMPLKEIFSRHETSYSIKHLSFFDLLHDREKALIQNADKSSFVDKKTSMSFNSDLIDKITDRMADRSGYTTSQLMAISSRLGFVDLTPAQETQNFSPTHSNVLKRFALGITVRGISRDLNIPVETTVNMLNEVQIATGAKTKLSAYAVCVKYGILKLPEVD